MKNCLRKLSALLLALAAVILCCLPSAGLAEKVAAESEKPQITIYVTGNVSDLPYTGSELSVSGYTLSHEGEPFDASLVSCSRDTAVSAVSVGEHKLGLLPADFTYRDENIQAQFVISTDVTLKISPVELNIYITPKVTTAEYNGSQQTFTGYNAVCDNPVFEPSRLLCGEYSATGTYPGYYPYTANFAYDDTEYAHGNIYVDPEENKLCIDTAKIAVTINGNTGGGTYSGSDFTVQGFTSVCDHLLFDPGKVAYSGKAEISASQAGTHYMNLDPRSFTYDDEYVDASFTVNDGYLEIAKAALKAEVTGNSGQLVYNGGEQSLSGYRVTSSDSAFSESKVVLNGTAVAKGTAAGRHDMGLTKESFSYDDPNYTVDFSVTDGFLDITRTTMNVTVTGHTSTSAYNGSEQKVEGFDSIGDKSFFSSGKVNYSGEAAAKGTDANMDPGYLMGLSGSGFSYDDPSVDVTFSVTDGWLKISKATISISVNGTKVSVPYNGKVQDAEGYTASSGDAAFSADKVRFSGTASVTGTDAGRYPIVLSKSQFSYDDPNVTAAFTVTNGELNITRRKVTLTSADAEKTYDGEPLTAQEVTAGDEGFAEGEGASYTVTGSQTDTGNSLNRFSYALNGNTKAMNYTITRKEGMLSVKAIEEPVTVTVTANSGTEMYDGTEKKVAGYKVSVSNKLYKETDFTFKGKAEVNGKDAGIYLMAIKPEDFTSTNKNFSNVKFVIVDGQLEITKRKVLLESESAEKPYDGQALLSKNVRVTGDGFAKGEGAEFDVTGSQTLAGSSLNTFEFKLTKDTKAENYEITKKEGMLTVTASDYAPAADDESSDGTGSHLTVRSYTTSSPANGKSYVNGENIYFTITVTNDGKTTVNYINITDQLSGAQWIIETLEPGEDRAFNTVYTVTDADASRGAVTHNVTGTGADPDGNRVTVQQFSAAEKTSVEERKPEPEPDPTPVAPDMPERRRSVANTVLTALTGGLSLWMLASALLRRNQYEDSGTGMSRILAFCGLIPAVASVITLMLTQDRGAVPAVANRWTPLMALLFIADIVLAAASFVTGRKGSDTEQT